MSGDREFLETTVEPQPDDSADVRWALETAVAMWIRGSRDQTLKWLHTAMQSATNDGRHDRAYALGRVLTDLEHRQLPVRRTNQPPAVAPSPASTTQPLVDLAKLAGASSSVSRPKKSLLQTKPYRVTPDELTSHFTPDSSLLEACQQSATDAGTEPLAPEAEPPTEFMPRPITRPRPPPIIHDGLEATLTNVRPSEKQQSERTVVMSAEELMAPSAKSVGPPTTVGSHQTNLEPMRALRVCVVRGQGRELVLRLLDEGEAPQEGAQEALIIPLARQKA